MYQTTLIVSFLLYWEVSPEMGAVFQQIPGHSSVSISSELVILQQASSLPPKTVFQ